MSNPVPSDPLPSVSVVMAIRNEAAYIGDTLRSVLAQDYPAEKIEVIIADGMSTDATREIIREVAAGRGNVRVIDNPGRIVSTGLNAAIREATGEIVVRVDGHCYIQPDFISRDIRLLQEHPEAWSVGGPIVHVAKGPFGKAAALAMGHPLGVGNAAHRFSHYEGYVEGAVFPALRRVVFERAGLFDEALVRNQDDELNYRIHLAGGKIYQSPSVRSHYWVRERPAQLFRQYQQYGFWRIPVMRKHGRPTTPRQLVPLLFYFVVAALLVAGFLLGSPLMALALPLFYFSVLIAVGLSFVPQHGWAVGLRVPVAMAVLHAGYAAGMLSGFWAGAFRKDAWSTAGKMARISR
jgi:succinoglycan biosynthesis protein ExoA